MANGKIICAVDFGTTYSGLAYAYHEEGVDPTDVETILIEDHWPGQGPQSSPKVPTVFKFDKSGTNGFKWGFELDDDPEKICFAKLYLDPSQIQAAQTLATISPKLGRLPPNRKVTDGISRYLAALRAVGLDRMEAEWTKEFVETTPVEYIITVPAVWSEKAKSDTLLCASQAGFGPVEKIRLITEPEAAAVYSFKTLSDNTLQKGDIFITCDAGGGTVDLTTYKVTSTEPVLRVGEVTIGSGGLCGSVYLNKRFEELVQKKIGKHLNALSATVNLNAINEVSRVFDEEIKPHFGTSDDPDKVYYVPIPTAIPDDEEAGIKNGQLKVTSVELKLVFDKVMRAIFQLIIEQIERVDASQGNPDVSAVLLVGGFGSSEYLRKAIEEHFGEDMKVLQPPDAWSAVIRGALLRGLQGDIVESRIIRAYYGVRMKEQWDPAIHESAAYRRKAEKLKVWDNIEQKHFCTGVMRWYVKKGDEFTNRRVVNFPFYRAITPDMKRVFSSDLYMYNGNEAPYFDDETCKSIGSMTSDLSQVPFSEFQVLNSGSGSYYRVNYELEMSFEATISFRLLFKGKVMGEARVDYRNT